MYSDVFVGSNIRLLRSKLVSVETGANRSEETGWKC